MNATQYNQQLDKLCSRSLLGEMKREPEYISGKVYAVETAMGKYAVKVLAPEAAINHKILQGYINSEKVAFIAKSFIPACAARVVDGAAAQEIDGSYFFLYDWVEGNHVTCKEMYGAHCQVIGGFLGELHRIDFSRVDVVDEYSKPHKTPDWDFYMQKGAENQSPWVSLLEGHKVKMFDFYRKSESSKEELLKNTVVSHCGLTPENVIWRNSAPVIIDWETAGFVNPYHDLIETALCWSEDADGKIDSNKFSAFLRGYKQRSPFKKGTDWNVAINAGYMSRIARLESSLKKSLGIGCQNAEEQGLYTERVTEITEALLKYEKTAADMKKWIAEIA
ncbi:MAG: phosphotransferase [Oscillospiraceae bacterium]|nr:phosphotransferase [Oscillospiraceae bacterium]